MDSHTISAVNRLEVVDTGRRRRWSDEEKARIVLESMAGPRLVSVTARRHGIARSQLLAWRRLLAADRREAPAGFVEAEITPGATALPAPRQGAATRANATDRRLEIALRNGRRVIVDAGVDVEALGRIVAVLDRR
jgi:transposase